MTYLSFKQAISTSIRSLLANKVRSFLTMLGIVIGVSSVIVIMSLGAGAQSLILSQIEDIGSNLLTITPGRSDEGGPPTSVLGVVITSLSLDDFKAIERAKQELGIDSLTAYVNGVATVSYRANSYSVSLEGVSEDYLATEGGQLEAGRFFTAEEVNNLAKMAILGQTAKQELFASSEALGRKIKIKNQVFEVIGILAERGTVAFQDYDDKILLPVKTMQKNIVGINYLNSIRLKINSDINPDLLISEVTDILRDQHDIKDQSGASDDFSVRSLTELMDMIKIVTDALRYFLALMAGLSLIVGGIGIMNIMLISVNDRTREIGLRKALGASNRDIVNQFLIEAVCLTLLGGLLGLVFALFASWLITVVITALGYEWAWVVSIWSILFALLISALIGLIFGLYPARKASRLEPVEALNYE